MSENRDRLIALVDQLMADDGQPPEMAELFRRTAVELLDGVAALRTMPMQARVIAETLQGIGRPATVSDAAGAVEPAIPGAGRWPLDRGAAASAASASVEEDPEPVREHTVGTVTPAAEA